MGCTSSSSISSKMYTTVGRKKKKVNIPEFTVFVPPLRVPVESDFQLPLKGILPRQLVDRLSTHRGRIVSLAEDIGGPALTELKRALDDYLPVLLGLTKAEYGLEELVDFKWKILQDRRQEAFCLENSWFEVLSIIHMLAVLSLSEANSLLIPKDHMDTCERNVSEEYKKDAIDLLLKASGYLELCNREILTRLPFEIKNRLPVDLQSGALEAMFIQALGQVTEMQLGIAVESQKATLSVKRRLACEQLNYFAQAHNSLSECNITHGYGKKHLLFIKWKYLEAKAAAYYYHGLILDKGSEPSCHISAVYCFLAAEELLADSKKACITFSIAAPVTRASPVWGVMKHLHQKIPEVASRKSQMYGYLLDQEKALQTLPDLPDFALSLRPDDYKLPEIDLAWDSDKWETQVQTLKEHLKDVEDETESE
ncbi:PREDICTED: uncharacterized protein LOC104592790 [Nelumbo nucifera]|uniref:Uncharacterized protein LOC104592790 n=2 Tax=Nelumbo nucifera TaxID=4432 RepID=A0A1U7ZCV4_NELNU|nr:PREDICTED: uncharacterized protein LOC104592790 [Nelumbo nucifera]XP_010250577.1 PREDICTED: uncharacterized protein LOC104592790 [Nelumbo nucifera]DAD34139.1 TPA_asm: hypothetical protein HUJ06_004779 [Nelumbo nucifera]